MTSRPPAIYVDVDDTLIRTFGTKRIPIPATVALVKALRQKGAMLYCWSRGGAAYAREVADQLGIAACFEPFSRNRSFFSTTRGSETGAPWNSIRRSARR
ncbi:HAD family hydrolase [Anaeromyxobacter oryzisoli]|uniref:hypothetical protein n=1 Tax=Anaeromyxobacter oryzisoli TaxID=2925408 RepID=UPI001F58DECF|nr:hypothetical protein [Anaeromyxobacter sp. SG63]